MKRLLLLLCLTNELLCAPVGKTTTNSTMDEQLRTMAHNIRLNKYRLERAVAAGTAIFFTLFTTGLLIYRAQESSDEEKSGGERINTVLPILLTAASAGCGIYYLEKYTNMEQTLAQGLINVALKP